MREFVFTELLPIDHGHPDTPWRLLTAEGISTVEVAGRRFLQVEPEVLVALTREAFRDISHLLRPGHLAQLRKIIDDPEASANDRFVAFDLLKNACIAAGGELPMCQDTGTAIVSGRKGELVLTGGSDEEAITRGVYDAYTQLNLRYSQMAPLTTWEEINTESNLPAQIEIYATGGAEYELLFMAKGGGSANKSLLFQETQALLTPARLSSWLDDKLRMLGTAACPPYHLALVIGGTSAEFALKVAKYASAHYLDSLPRVGDNTGHAIRDVELEAEVWPSPKASALGHSSAASTSVTTCGSFACRAMARRAPSPWPCRAPLTARPWPR